MIEAVRRILNFSLSVSASLCPCLISLSPKIFFAQYLSILFSFSSGRERIRVARDGNWLPSPRLIRTVLFSTRDAFDLTHTLALAFDLTHTLALNLLKLNFDFQVQAINVKLRNTYQEDLLAKTEENDEQ